MTVKYKTVITKAGAEKLAAATVPNGKKVNFTAMAVGDGGGQLPTPNASQTKLINEVWRHALNKISQDKKNKNYVVAELLIPPEIGGFWMREMGLYDDTGTLIAVGNMAESYKPALAEGSGRAQTVRMVIMVSDIASVELSIDSSTIMATQEYVNEKLTEHELSRRHPDASLTAKGFTQLSSAIDSMSEILAATPKAVKVAYDLANAKYTAADATTVRKGIVQLSSMTDSVSEALAATPKAVKSVSDEIVKLKESLGTASKANVVTSLIDSTSGRLPVVGWMGLGGIRDTRVSEENFSSFWRDTTIGKSGITIPYDGTPTISYLAVDAANQHAYVGRRKGNEAISWVKLYSEFNKPMSQDVFGTAMGIGGGADLNAYTAPGLYYQPANVQAQSGKNYPETVAGSLQIYKHAGITQIYRVYSNSRSYIRTLYNGVWSAWTKQYDAANKPSADDVDAVSAVNGGTFRKLVSFNEGLEVRSRTGIVSGNDAASFDSANMILKSWYGIGFYSTLLDSVGKETGMTGYINTRNGLLQMKGQIIPGDYGNFDTRFIRLAGSQNISGILRSSSEYQSTSANSYRSVYGNYGTFWRNDGANLYLMVTNAGDQYGAYNDLRPLAINLASGYPTMSRLALSDYTNFDARYYTKSQSDAGYMPKVSAYTKAESDARYQTKGNYITGVRFGASAEYNERGNTERMTGGVMTSFADRGSSNYWIRLRPLQYQINGGAWVTAAYA
ncbi:MULTISPECIES: phage tail protein [Enterobacter cloacae complex]|uniref:phage tail-collar fiber domain-containing protein n=1 Tax=Enterobacter cloacae complex TaxID=354276 RepID=UPI000D0B850C|nr:MULTISPECIES: phage tail protein [Enterobacter cloacae complex]AVO99693.1 phage tail protein [Enterobacter cloacae complex sp. FDA-CDC-AR_0132]EKS7199835.1 phage tail protein [Enterobacter ludwigii]EKV3582828.1 phage tail protein [Enterobacter ludwigii]MBQ0226540.1 phage tail protein [Enterobacter ludwigii]MDY3575651.1 phage tail protein [Enterobacter ludwigii]